MAPPEGTSERSRNLRSEDAASRLAFEALGSGRLPLLTLLREQPLRYTELARRSEASDGELSRNLGRLQEAGLVAKGSNGALVLTPLARAVLSLVPALRVLGTHAPFFRTHDVGALPGPLLQGLGALEAAKVLDDPFGAFAAFQDVVRGVEAGFEGSWVLGRAAFSPEELEIQRELRDRIVQRRARARGVLLPEELPQLERLAPGYRSYFEVRTLPALPVTVAVSDRAAMLQFAGPDGRIDWGYTFAGPDPEFVGFCRALFEHQWAAARPG